jgi:hypothetical protein
MEVNKIGVIYDTSYLTGGFQSVRKFILSRRFWSKEKKGLVGALRSLMVGKGAKPGTADTVYHEPGSLFYVYEVIPNEVLTEIASEGLEPQAVSTLLEDGAVRVDLCMDTVVGEHGLSGQKLGAPPGEAATGPDTGERIALYATRLVTYGTKERFDLAVVATEDPDLLARLAEIAGRGKAVVGLTSQQLSETRQFHDRLTALANLGRPNPLVLED